MFSGKQKVEVNNEELRIIRVAVVDFRNELIRANDYTDVTDEVLVKLKNKMKLDKYQLGTIIQCVFEKEKNMKDNNEDTSVIDDLLLNLIDIKKNMSK